MAKVNKEAKRIINDFGPSFIATAGKDGKPSISAHGLFQVLDDKHVLFCEIASPRIMTNLMENPRVSALMYERSTHKGCRVSGGAEIFDSGKLFDETAKKFAARGVKVRHVVKVEVEEICTFQSGRLYFYQPIEE